MQSLEAVLHLAWKAAEAAAKSIEFVSREGDREGMGRQKPTAVGAKRKPRVGR